MNRLTFLTLLILLITSYSCRRVKIVEQPYKPTTIDENGYEYLVPSSIFSPAEIPEELKGTVVVFLQGGPVNYISKSQLLSLGVEDTFTNYSNEINYLLKNDVQYILVKEGGRRSMMEHQYFKKVRDFIRE